MFNSTATAPCCAKNNNKNKAVNSFLKFVKPSIFCSIKGTIIFTIGFIHMLNGLPYFVFNPAIGKRKIKEGGYTMKYNLVPTLEILCSILFLYKMQPHSIKQWLFCIGVCWASMIGACTALRATGFRTDCCSQFDVESTFSDTEGNFNSLCMNTPYDFSPLPPRNVFSKTIERLTYALPFQLLLVANLTEQMSNYVINKSTGTIPPSTEYKSSKITLEFCANMASLGMYKFTPSAE